MNDLRKHQLLGDIRALEQTWERQPDVQTRAILVLARVLLELGDPSDVAGPVDRRLDAILSHVRAIQIQGVENAMATAEVKAALGRIDATTNNIAADVKRLKDKVGTGMSEAEVAEVQADAERIATRLEGIANDPDNPDPDQPAA